jgi:DNA-directed RNA polymerase specialized sigma24 family protein
MIAPAQLRVMARTWRALPECDRAIFAAVRFEALDYVAAAERHGCTVDDVEQTIARVLVAFDRAASD